MHTSMPCLHLHQCQLCSATAIAACAGPMQHCICCVGCYIRHCDARSQDHTAAAVSSAADRHCWCCLQCDRQAGVHIEPQLPAAPQLGNQGRVSDEAATVGHLTAAIRWLMSSVRHGNQGSPLITSADNQCPPPPLHSAMLPIITPVGPWESMPTQCGSAAGVR
jgi:hypothetical protein